MKKPKIRFDILSLFPEYFEGPFNVSMIQKAKKRGLIEIALINMRDFASGRYQQIDDRPYGGGPGMVLMVEPVVKAIRSVKTDDSHVIYLTPQGTLLTARRCKELSQKKHLVVLCGHYEGIDERAIELEVSEELSIGDFVLTSGAPAAIVLVDSVSRFVPGVIGNASSTDFDSFEHGLFDSPVFTRPGVYEGKEVPPCLRGGNHAEVDAWRQKMAREKTKRVRPDLYREN